jgi:hypothetical protein
MKKIVRLTESELVRLVERIIKEDDVEDECEGLIDLMGYIYDSYIESMETNPDEIDPEIEFENFEREIEDILYRADEIDCKNYDDIEYSANGYIQMMFEHLELN